MSSQRRHSHRSRGASTQLTYPCWRRCVTQLSLLLLIEAAIQVLHLGSVVHSATKVGSLATEVTSAHGRATTATTAHSHIATTADSTHVLPLDNFGGHATLVFSSMVTTILSRWSVTVPAMARRAAVEASSALALHVLMVVSATTHAPLAVGRVLVTLSFVIVRSWATATASSSVVARTTIATKVAFAVEVTAEVVVAATGSAHAAAVASATLAVVATARSFIATSATAGAIEAATTTAGAVEATSAAAGAVKATTASRLPCVERWVLDGITMAATAGSIAVMAATSVVHTSSSLVVRLVVAAIVGALAPAALTEV
mmetsp:Transcript_33911/g.44720  ORF Transcript_33911/g.44720 Transcript_33911/m.44720 type:complete len:316 (-) Transcript_33911:1686-2633(-)|eukprot:CAMPEP_0185567798 /NCGR_PEP_ID=MMETSP0434-20130131/944_1 /TAXON_ID=626734 ORGANISM="Favella taraikaensis, Strain Fe Narragansett Bay" /NCGR_SAMPLE_ID=MMETSP0434 /ASSEMBLY_ACC=CAM_ASM_000379 /LENGTH=315 /DNA_ID=CAMNT_0028182105 /DNA_START=563 /DNA_END=1510 /DNA_ORIENTATION=-